MLTQKLQSDLKEAQLARDETKVSTLRLLLSEINNLKISKGVEELPDLDITSQIQKEVKKRQESILSFKNGGREELAAKEQSELEILTQYLPAQLGDEELTKVVESSINELGAKSIADMGKVMGLVMSKVGTSADSSRVAALAKEKLSV